MPWFKVDDAFTFHPKVVSAGNAAIGAWIRIGAYCSAHLTDGFIADLTARMIAAPAELDALVACGLLHASGSGYQVHEYLKYQQSKKQVEDEREAGRRRKKTGTSDSSPGIRPEGRRESARTPGIGISGSVSESSSVSEGESAERGELPGNPNATTRAMVDRWREVAELVLGAVNVARKRLRPSSRGISASYDSLSHIAARLDAGKSAADCLHVVEVCEAECRRSADSFRWFDAVTPFRPENFERKSASDPALIAGEAEARRVVGHARASARYDKTSDGTGDL